MDDYIRNFNLYLEQVKTNKKASMRRGVEYSRQYYIKNKEIILQKNRAYNLKKKENKNKLKIEKNKNIVLDFN